MYAMSYFRTEAEALHLALSVDGLLWTPLNDNRPILQGTVGSCSLRDPFVARARDGLFHLLASDGWASVSIVHAVSVDLLHWSDQVLIPVMASVPDARNAWAPECFYDHGRDLYRVLWSSAMRSDRTVEDWDHRIWASATADFVSYTPAEPFFDPGYSVIDATVVYHEGEYLMAFKDERGENLPDTAYKAIRVCRSHDGTVFESISDLVTPTLVEGPTLFRHRGRWIMAYDHFMGGHFGAAESADGRTWRAIREQVRFPSGARHGSVFSVDEAKASDLRRATL